MIEIKVIIGIVLISAFVLLALCHTIWVNRGAGASRAGGSRGGGGGAGTGVVHGDGGGGFSGGGGGGDCGGGGAKPVSIVLLH